MEKGGNHDYSEREEERRGHSGTFLSRMTTGKMGGNLCLVDFPGEMSIIK